MTDNWHFSGCVVCGYIEHTPRPHDHCPNDGFPLARLPATVDASERFERLRALFEPIADRRRVTPSEFAEALRRFQAADRAIGEGGDSPEKVLEYVRALRAWRRVLERTENDWPAA